MEKQRMGFVIGVLLAISSTALAQSKGDVQSIVEMLYAYEVPSSKQWSDFGPETLNLLVRVYDNADSPTYARIRAVNAAGHYHTEQSRSFLRRVLQTPSQKPVVTRHAISAIERAFGADSLGDIQPMLSSADMSVRQAAAVSIAKMKSTGAEKTLNNYLKTEQSKVIQKAVRKARGSK